MTAIPIRSGLQENMSQKASEDENGRIKVLDEDPYKHVSDLGDGAYGIVDKVEKGGRVYARKKIRVTRRNQDQILTDTKKEFDILKRLKHHHVIDVVEVFQCKGRLRIIMSQVADTDLKEYMEQLDAVEDNRKRRRQIARMKAWPGCLISAINYLHDMKIKHRDLKPANILIMGDKVLIADFGVSKDLIDEETTASLIDANTAGTPMYWAPEVIPTSKAARRGRAVDIFALGCIFLEIATLHMNEQGVLRRFGEYRHVKGSTAFGRCTVKVLRWIIYLIGDVVHAMGKESYYSERLEMMLNLSQLAILMLDPEPKTRISAQQLVALFEFENHEYEVYEKDKNASCSQCNFKNWGKLRLRCFFQVEEPFLEELESLDDLEDVLNSYPEDDDDFELSVWQEIKQDMIGDHAMFPPSTTGK